MLDCNVILITSTTH